MVYLVQQVQNRIKHGVRYNMDKNMELGTIWINSIKSKQSKRKININIKLTFLN